VKIKQFKLSATALAVALGLAACGGGGAGSMSLTTSGTASGTTQGVIAAFGSVFVNGVEYEIDNATSVTADGANATEADLDVGMVVTLKGTVNADGKTGAASAITYADELEGVVTANSVVNGVGTLTVMGQSVNVDENTVFASKVASVTTPDQIVASTPGNPGNIVEASGYASSSNGEITATRLEVKAPSQVAGEEIEVKGVISSLTATTFTLGALTVDYSGATELPAAGLADGQYVEVKSTTQFDGTGPLLASKVEREDNGVKGHEGSEGEEIKIAGMVTTSYSSASGQFELNGEVLMVTDGTEFEGGSSTDLTSGAKVDVEAEYDASGNLIAKSVEFGHSSELGMSGVVEAAAAAAGTVTIMGQVIHADNSTMMVDDSSARVRYFGVKDLSAQDYVEVKAYVDSATGDMVAVTLQREDGTGNASESEVQGTATAGADASTWVVAGVTVDVSTVATLPTVDLGTTVVEVAGAYDDASGVLNATTVTVEH
jgi:hypothetical protein